jgi:hypothetical protein
MKKKELQDMVNVAVHNAFKELIIDTDFIGKLMEQVLAQAGEMLKESSGAGVGVIEGGVADPQDDDIIRPKKKRVAAAVDEEFAASLTSESERISQMVGGNAAAMNKISEKMGGFNPFDAHTLKAMSNLDAKAVGGPVEASGNPKADAEETMNRASIDDAARDALIENLAFSKKFIMGGVGSRIKTLEE